MNKIAKAIVGAVVAGGLAYQVAVADNVLTGEEIGLVVTAVLGSLGLVWAVPNATAVPTDRSLR